MCTFFVPKNKSHTNVAPFYFNINNKRVVLMKTLSQNDSCVCLLRERSTKIIGLPNDINIFSSLTFKPPVRYEAYDL